MRKKKAKKALDRAEDRLQDAQEKLRRAQQKQEKAQTKAETRNTELKPAQADKLSASIDEERENVEKAQKQLKRVRNKFGRTAKTSDVPTEAVSVDLTNLDVRAAGTAIEAALSDSPAVSVTGEMPAAHEPLVLTLPGGTTVLWKASLSSDCPQAAVILQCAPGGEESSVPVFCAAAGGVISTDGEGGRAVECSTATMLVDGGLVRSRHGEGVRSDGQVQVLNGVVTAEGALPAIRAEQVELKGGFVLGCAANSAVAGTGDLTAAAIVQPLARDALKEGSCCVCAWTAVDGRLPSEDGSEAGLTYWPEDACVWWDVAPDGATSLYAGRGSQSNSVQIGTQSLPKPPDMQKAGTKTVALPIVFEAKTETSDRQVLLDIAWGWDLFLGRRGALQYDNRLAIAACAMSSSVYHEDEIIALFQRMGFTDPVLRNYKEINATSAFALAHAQIHDGRTRKTIFAVANRGSKTLMDWKGNILDETIQNAQFFGQCADTVAAALQDYVRTWGQKKLDDNLFFITGHSLGAIVTDLLAAQHFREYPAQNVYAYAFAAPLADPESKVDDSRPIYNILNQNDVVTSFPPRPGYKRVGTDNYTFSTRGKNASVMARPFRFLSHMDIDVLSHMSSFTGFFQKALPSIMWNHSLTTYMAYLLAGGPDSVKESKGLWSMVQNIITAAGDIGRSDE